MVAHELAHSWTGNLVTNATAEHFWLNEGFTVFAERRILEALEGAEVAALHAALGRRALEEALRALRAHPELTAAAHAPRRASIPTRPSRQVPYEKGYLFLRALEEAVGAAGVRRLPARYVEHVPLPARSPPSDFVRLRRRASCPGVLAQVDAERVARRAGRARRARPRPRSGRLEALVRLARHGALRETRRRHWTPTEWQLYLESLPRTLPRDTLRAQLDERFQPHDRARNYEVLVAWLVAALPRGLRAGASRAPRRCSARWAA